MHRSGGPCQTLYIYTYGVHVPHHSCAIGAPRKLHTIGPPLRRYTPSTVQAHVRALLRDKYTTRSVHAEPVHARIHVLTTIGTPHGRHMPTAVHVNIPVHTYEGTPLGLRMPKAVPYAHPRNMRLTCFSINSERTPPGNQQAAAQQRVSSIRACTGPVRVLYTRVLHSSAPINTYARPRVHYCRNPHAVRSQMGKAGDPRWTT